MCYIMQWVCGCTDQHWDCALSNVIIITSGWGAGRGVKFPEFFWNAECYIIATNIIVRQWACGQLAFKCNYNRGSDVCIAYRMC